MRDLIHFWSEVSIVFYFETCRMLPAFLSGAMLSTYLSKLLQTKHSKTGLMHI